MGVDVFGFELLQFLFEIGGALHEGEVVLRFTQLIRSVFLELLFLTETVNLLQVFPGPPSFHACVVVYLVAIFLILFADVRA